MYNEGFHLKDDTIQDHIRDEIVRAAKDSYYEGLDFPALIKGISTAKVLSGYNTNKLTQNDIIFIVRKRVPYHLIYRRLLTWPSIQNESIATINLHFLELLGRLSEFSSVPKKHLKIKPKEIFGQSYYFWMSGALTPSNKLVRAGHLLLPVVPGKPDIPTERLYQEELEALWESGRRSEFKQLLSSLASHLPTGFYTYDYLDADLPGDVQLSADTRRKLKRFMATYCLAWIRRKTPSKDGHTIRQNVEFRVQAPEVLPELNGAGTCIFIPSYFRLNKLKEIPGIKQSMNRFDTIQKTRESALRLRNKAKAEVSKLAKTMSRFEAWEQVRQKYALGETSMERYIMKKPS